MLKKPILMLVMLSMLAFYVTSAFSAPPVAQVSLISVSYMKEKGVTFKFYVTGDVKKSDMKGYIVIDGKTRTMYCNYSGDATPVVVVCTAQKATAKFARSQGSVSLLGRSFFFVVPARIN